jgi:O-antigen biosynthesis protein
MKISVVVIAKNESGFINKCLEAILRQSRQDFELIIVDNGSTDGTGNIVNSHRDERIRYFYQPAENSIAEIRNHGAKRASGEYVFFTDADCAPDKHWLEEGVKILEDGACVGVEGKTYYESEQNVTVSDNDTHQFAAGGYMTCNVAYRRDILHKVHYFDAHFRYGHEDRDLAFRVMQFGKIVFSPDMMVAHQKKKLTTRSLKQRTRRAEDMVYFIKKHGKNTDIRGCFLYPAHLGNIIFPPLMLLTASHNTFRDLAFTFLRYVFYVRERTCIWKASIQNRIFIL